MRSTFSGIVLRMERFDPEGRRVMRVAQIEANRAGTAHVALEHLAIAILTTPEAVRVARRVGTEREPHLDALRARCAMLPPSTGGAAVLDYMLLQALSELERQLGNRAIGVQDLALMLTEHLLLPRSIAEGLPAAPERIARSRAANGAAIARTGAHLRRLLGTTAKHAGYADRVLRMFTRVLRDQHIPGLSVELSGLRLTVGRQDHPGRVRVFMPPGNDILILEAHAPEYVVLRRFGLDAETLAFHDLAESDELEDALCRAIVDALYPEIREETDVVRVNLPD